MQQKVKEHLAETNAKTMFYIVYGAVILVFPLALSLLTRLIVGATWTHKYNNIIMGVGFGIAVGAAEVVATRVAKRAKKLSSE